MFFFVDCFCFPHIPINVHSIVSTINSILAMATRVDWAAFYYYICPMPHHLWCMHSCFSPVCFKTLAMHSHREIGIYSSLHWIYIPFQYSLWKGIQFIWLTQIHSHRKWRYWRITNNIQNIFIRNRFGIKRCCTEVYGMRVEKSLCCIFIFLCKEALSDNRKAIILLHSIRIVAAIYILRFCGSSSQCTSALL